MAYYRPSEWSSLEIEIDREPYRIPNPVIEHFRNIRNIRALKAKPRVKVITTVFVDRALYTQRVLRSIRAAGNDRCLVFLDPDTGLEPDNGKPGLEHVRESELLTIWRALRKGDLLVFYQHRTNRRNEEWIEPKRKQFERALRLPDGRAKVAHERTTEPKVKVAFAFFYVQKAQTRKTGRRSRARLGKS